MGSRRSETTCALLGPYKELDDRQLPVTRDVIKFILFTKNELKLTRNGKDPSNTEVFSIVSERLITIWTKASLPVVTKDRVHQLLKCCFEKYLNLIRYPKTKRNDSYERKVNCFLESSQKLFDIAACKCTSFETCSCIKPRKVPITERDFLLDQRSERKMVISGIDTKETARLIKKNQRLEETIKRIDKKTSASQEADPVSVRELPSRQRVAAVELSTNVLVTEETPSTSANRNTLALPTVAKVCDRFGLSTRSAAAVASAVLADVGLVSSNDQSLVIDKNKVHRAVSKARTEACKNIDSIVVKSIYFDGRKDKTLVNEKIGERYHRKEVLEEHISVLAEPGSIYLGHTTPSRGTAKEIVTSIVFLLENQGLNLDEVICVGCDGTATNTGWKGGIIQYLEKYFERPLQWCVCMLHANELPLRHLFMSLDGSTSGPKAYSGPIGKELAVCETKTPVPFCAVAGNLPELPENVVNELSTDQSYLYEICQAIISGSCSPDLASRQPGKMAHSRWLTTANRILRLYVSTASPSYNLQLLVNYVVKVYAPVWFQIKQKSSFKDGAKHIFRLMMYSRFLPDNQRSIVDSVIERNAFFAHPENILITMLFDDRNYIQELALRRIIKARTAKKSNSLRVFKPPKLNFSAQDYTEIIVWQECEISAPPVLRNISDDDLRRKLNEKSLEVVDFPCHTQSVERCVKLVTEASLSVTNAKHRDGFIRNRLISRAEMPNFGHKNQFRF